MKQKIPQRIIITLKGTEIQDQLRDILKKESKYEISSSHRNVEGKKFKSEFIEENQIRYNEYRKALLNQPNALDQLEKYTNFVQSNLTSPIKINSYLKSKIMDEKKINAKFIDREVEKIAQTIYKNSRNEDRVAKSLPFLDFRQTQYMKGKYEGQVKNSGLFHIKKDTDAFSQTQGTGTFLKNPSSVHEIGNKKVTQLMFHESKLERMMTKYQKFHNNTQNMPTFSETYKRDVFSQPKFLQDLHKDKKETRVETLEELKTKLKDKLNLLTYQTDIQKRHKEVMQELHYSRYKKNWNRRRFPGEDLNKLQAEIPEDAKSQLSSSRNYNIQTQQ